MPALAIDPVFNRDLFLLRQQLLRISDKYDVCDETGANILYMERPAHFLQNFGALLAGLAASVAVFLGVGTIAEQAPPTSAARAILVVLAVLLALTALLAVSISLSAKRHLSVYRDASKRERLIEVLQDKKFQPITMTFTVRDFRGQPLARLAKNWLYNVFRKRWYVYAPGPEQHLLFVAKEDSVLRSLLRRFLGPLFGVLRTNFIILRPDSEDLVGEFKRKFTILDRYVLDMSADPQQLMDRRIALALGVMLDTGERR